MLNEHEVPKSISVSANDTSFYYIPCNYTKGAKYYHCHEIFDLKHHIAQFYCTSDCNPVHAFALNNDGGVLHAAAQLKRGYLVVAVRLDISDDPNMNVKDAGFVVNIDTVIDDNVYEYKNEKGTTKYALKVKWTHEIRGSKDFLLDDTIPEQLAKVIKLALIMLRDQIPLVKGIYSRPDIPIDEIQPFTVKPYELQ